MRFVKFSVVGLFGIGVQLGVLMVLEQAGWPAAAATLAAVEAAVLHNFVWHERWTWTDRPGSTVRRLRRFHLSSGLISLVGNTSLTLMLAAWGVPLAVANAVGIAACSAVNFCAADRLVFDGRT